MRALSVFLFLCLGLASMTGAELIDGPSAVEPKAASDSVDETVSKVRKLGRTLELLEIEAAAKAAAAAEVEQEAKSLRERWRAHNGAYSGDRALTGYLDGAAAKLKAESDKAKHGAGNLRNQGVMYAAADVGKADNLRRSLKNSLAAKAPDLDRLKSQMQGLESQINGNHLRKPDVRLYGKKMMAWIDRLVEAESTKARLAMLGE